MTMIYTVSCNACKNGNLHNKPHVQVVMRPGFQGSVRDMHFCDTKCLAHYHANLDGVFKAHAEDYVTHMQQKRTRDVQKQNDGKVSSTVGNSGVQSEAPRSMPD